MKKLGKTTENPKILNDIEEREREPKNDRTRME